MSRLDAATSSQTMTVTMKDRLIKKFEDEIHALDRELKLELPKEIKRARELGDLRENAEYSAAKERQRLVESRISMLQKRVAEIALINVDRIPTDRAGFGSTVHVTESNGEHLVFQLVMPEDADAAKGLISTTSPIGRAFLNKEPGDSVKVITPGGTRALRDRQALHHPRRCVGMTRRGDRSNAPSSEPYSPQRRTALLLVGTGTAGAYHAGVLRALHEAGVKIDVVGGRGAGVVSALFAAIDGAPRLWDENGFWKSPAVVEVLSLASDASPARLGRSRSRSALVAVPLAAMAAALIVFPIDFVLKMLGCPASGLTGALRALCRGGAGADRAADVAAAARAAGAVGRRSRGGLVGPAACRPAAPARPVLVASRAGAAVRRAGASRTAGECSGIWCVGRHK